MKKIDWNSPIQGGDGISRNREEIEEFFIDLFENEIRENLNKLKSEFNPPDPVFVPHLDIIIKFLNRILRAYPENLQNITQRFKRDEEDFYNRGKTKEEISFYRKKLQKAFNYDGFRKALLNRLAVVLNVKACLYCNQQYTLAFGKSPNKKGDISLRGSTAFLQFDHFYGKSEFPIVSMSLYNLIPSCPICNQKKSKSHLSLKYHPYVNDLSSMLCFRIKSEDAFINPGKPGLDYLEIEIDTRGDKDLKSFVDKLEIEKRYSRHLDIVKELEVALYMSKYYEKHLDDIIPVILRIKSNSTERDNILLRHFRGFYTDSGDINKRPLTKFCQDIYEQLCSWNERDL